MKCSITCLTLAIAIASVPVVSWAAECPAEVKDAQVKVSKAEAALKAPRSTAGARGQELQAPRGQELQAPRGQELQAPRNQDLQAPRKEELQAPRDQELQAPRGQGLQAPRVRQAEALVRQAEAACQKGDMTLAARKAKEAMALID